MQAQGPYQLVDGTSIADNWADLIGGSLDHPINVDDHGDPLPDPTALNDVWTATTTAGERYLIGDIVVDCENRSAAGTASTCATRGNRLYYFQQS